MPKALESMIDLYVKLKEPKALEKLLDARRSSYRDFEQLNSSKRFLDELIEEMEMIKAVKRRGRSCQRETTQRGEGNGYCCLRFSSDHPQWRDCGGGSYRLEHIGFAFARRN